RRDRRPSASTAVATSSTCACRRPVATTSAPASASPSARALPIPLVPPTTTATRPDKSHTFFTLTPFPPVQEDTASHFHGAGAPPPALLPELTPRPQRAGDAGGFGPLRSRPAWPR